MNEVVRLNGCKFVIYTTKVEVQRYGVRNVTVAKLLSIRNKNLPFKFNRTPKIKSMAILNPCDKPNQKYGNYLALDRCTKLTSSYLKRRIANYYKKALPKLSIKDTGVH